MPSLTSRLLHDAQAALLQLARRLLARIALEVGFADEGHLGNRFRRRFGATPGAVRRGAALQEGRTDV